MSNKVGDVQTYPLHLIDFETAAVELPFHVGRRPYEQVDFQFSHHVLEDSLPNDIRLFDPTPVFASPLRPSSLLAELP
jgi:hypothetical protein